MLTEGFSIFAKPNQCWNEKFQGSKITLLSPPPTKKNNSSPRTSPWKSPLSKYHIQNLKIAQTRTIATPYYLESRSGSLQGCPKHSSKLASAGMHRPDSKHPPCQQMKVWHTKHSTNGPTPVGWLFNCKPFEKNYTVEVLASGLSISYSAYTKCRCLLISSIKVYFFKLTHVLHVIIKLYFKLLNDWVFN